MLAIAFPAIDPIALQIGPLAIRWYSLAYVVGIVIGWRFIIHLIRRSPADIERQMIDDFVLWATLGVILGGRLGFVLFYRPDFYFANPLEIPALWRGGMSFHGGVLGMVCAVILFARRRGISALSLGDLVCAAAPIGLLFGRIANFINGELYGRVSDVPWAMVFPRGGPDPRHPSQLYEAGLEGLVLFIVLAVLVYGFKALNKPGMILGGFFAGYGIARFIVEFFREPDSYLGFLYAGATMGQLLSLPLMAAGAALIWQAVRRR
jgi:phosphatidylglycerol:prolipoprotein diacylglycerol transferase